MTDKKIDRPTHGVRRIILSLPAKITGIVFWGLVLVGLMVAVVLLDLRERELGYRYQLEANMIAYELENAIEHSDGDGNVSTNVYNRFNGLQHNYPLRGLEFTYRGQSYRFGEISSIFDVYPFRLHIHHASHSLADEHIDLRVYMPALVDVAENQRKDLLLGIGALLFLFGLILQQILQKVLSRPFLNMVGTAENFVAGNNQQRFDETRADEFGYLAQFINRALDAIMKHQRDIEISHDALFEEKERAEVTLHSIMDAVITTDAEGRVQYMNPATERLTGWTEERARDTALVKVIRLLDEESGERLKNPIEACLQENRVVDILGHAILVRLDGETVAIEASAAPMRNRKGEVIGAVMVIQDVSQARRLTRQLSYQASHDALTGLYNRRMFEDHLQASLLTVHEENRQHALCYIDLDQFKIVNDTCGHMAGDELLRQLAGLLHSAIREGDVLARLGGDEFGVLLENCPLAQAKAIADKIRQQVKNFRFIWQDKTFEIGASIGVVGITLDNLDIATIMSAADVACYTAKDMGRNRVHIYEASDSLLVERHGQMHWANRLVQALDENRLVLFQQPIVGLNGHSHEEHSEILLRLRDEDGEIVRPDTFIPSAERYNLMARIDRWVIHQVFSLLEYNELNQQEVTINLSGVSLVEDELLRFILKTARDHKINLEQICFEITETAAISHLGKACHFMQQLKKQGCRFALDDFGSGLSSFGYLKNLPVDYLKIDGSFVKDISIDPIDKAMVESINRLGHVMGIRTVAEWVENEDILKIIKEIGVDYAQGYHLGTPKEMRRVH